MKNENKKGGIIGAACVRLGIEQFSSQDFFSPVSDIIHSSDPFHLVFCFEGFCDSFSGFHLK
jgi:hypothetical protein